MIRTNAWCRLLTITCTIALSACASNERTAIRPWVRAEAARSESTWSPIGHSIERRPILARTISTGTPRILIIGSIHGDEPEGLAAIDALAAHLTEHRHPAGVRIIRDLNPDGTAAGTRGNARGIDLNRNFPAANFARSRSRGASPLSEPESAALLAELDRFSPEIVIVLHSIASGPFVNFDGPASHLAEAFVDAAASIDPRWRVVPSMGYPTPGSLGTLVGVDRGIPILTIELRRGERSGPREERSLIASVDAMLALLSGPPEGWTTPVPAAEVGFE